MRTTLEGKLCHPPEEVNVQTTGIYKPAGLPEGRIRRLGLPAGRSPRRPELRGRETPRPPFPGTMSGTAIQLPRRGGGQAQAAGDRECRGGPQLGTGVPWPYDCLTVPHAARAADLD